MSRYEELIGQIRDLRLPLIAEQSLMNDVNILVGGAEESYELQALTFLDRNLTKNELFALLESFDDDVKLNEYIGEKYVHIFFSFIKTGKAYHLVLKDDKSVKIGKFSFQYKTPNNVDFADVMGYVENKIHEAVKCSGRQQPKIECWDFTTKNFDYSDIIERKIKGVRKYMEGGKQPKDKNPKVRSLDSY